MSDHQARPPIRHGQGLAEYALILALIAIVAIIALIFLGGQVSTILSQTQADRVSAAPMSPAPASGGVHVSPVNGTTLLASGSARPDGVAILIRIVCPSGTGQWRPAEAGYDESWIALLKPAASSGCKVQAAEVRDDALVIFGEAPLELPPPR